MSFKIRVTINICLSIFTPRVQGKKELALAGNLIKEGNLVEALDMAKKALQIIRQQKNHKEIAFANAKVLEIQGLMHRENDNWKSAAGAFSQAGRYFKQAKTRSDEARVMQIQAELLLKIGKQRADEKRFESAASSFEEAALSYKQIGMEIDALEVRAKACVFRAASVRNPIDRKSFLLQAVELIRTSGIDNPLVLGHLNYYTAMVQRLSDMQEAIDSLDTAIAYYSEANSSQMIASAKALQDSLKKL